MSSVKAQPALTQALGYDLQVDLRAGPPSSVGVPQVVERDAGEACRDHVVESSLVELGRFS
jgi:hypothetical protein